MVIHIFNFVGIKEKIKGFAKKKAGWLARFGCSLDKKFGCRF
jgi:hypothetical protein